MLVGLFSFSGLPAQTQTTPLHAQLTELYVPYNTTSEATYSFYTSAKTRSHTSVFNSKDWEYSIKVFNQEVVVSLKTTLIKSLSQADFKLKALQKIPPHHDDEGLVVD